ncbi:hypothetical protein GBAR_LOCUS22761 [Geodia barretti]|uniref:Death domain-containing protein n=1 Tax=Geodia barretti TaxID=519541 RepID=A0AA35T3T2_GEOBA|nr:hypothetical protein GBAR_LOCUS22761 [Geodia barretti]
MGNQSSSEEDDYGGGYHHPSQQPPGGGDGDSDEEPKPIYRPSEDRLQFNLRLKPKFSDLMTLKTVAGDEIKLLKKLKRRWKELCVYSGIDKEGETIRKVESKHGSHGDDQCMYDVVQRWLDHQGLEPITWATFIEILEDMNLTELSRDVHRALHYRIDHRSY